MFIDYNGKSVNANSALLAKYGPSRMRYANNHMVSTNLKSCGGTNGPLSYAKKTDKPSTEMLWGKNELSRGILAESVCVSIHLKSTVE